MTCKWEGCNKPTVNNSQYCYEHKAKARQAWLENVRASSEERQDRYAKFAQAHEKAHQAGLQAGQNAIPTPMVVYDSEIDMVNGQLVDRPKENGKQYYVPEGVCGFAWITVRPGNSSLANWLKKHADADRDYYGGVSVWVHEFGQSYERKRAYAKAYANTLRSELADPKLTITAGSRLD